MKRTMIVRAAFCLWLMAIAAGSRTLWTHAADTTTAATESSTATVPAAAPTTQPLAE